MKNFILFLFLFISANNLLAQDIKMQYFLEAMAQGNLEKMEQYLYAGVDINGNVKGKETPLMIAVQQGNDVMAEFLISKGANVNGYYNDSKTVYSGTGGRYGLGGGTTITTQVYVMNVAVQNYYKNQDVVKLLLEKGANPDVAINDAISLGSLKLIELMSDKGARFRFNDEDLIKAAEKNNVPLAQVILSKGTLPNAWSFIYAIRNNNLDLVKLMVQKGGDVNYGGRNSAGAIWSPLCEAVNANNLTMLKYLVEEAGANLNSYCGYVDAASNVTYSLTDWSTGTYCKCRGRNKEITEYLLLAPGIQRQKEAQQKEKLLREKEATEITVKSLREVAEKFLKDSLYAKAIETYQKVYELSNNNSDLLKMAEIAYLLNDHNQVIAYLDRAGANDNASISKRAFAYMQLGEHNKARSYFEGMVEKADNYEQKRTAHYHMACFYAVTDNPAAAIDHLNKALKNGYNKFDVMDKDPHLTKVRNTPEYQKLLKKYDK